MAFLTRDLYYFGVSMATDTHRRIVHYIPDNTPLMSSHMRPKASLYTVAVPYEEPLCMQDAMSPLYERLKWLFKVIDPIRPVAMVMATKIKLACGRNETLRP
jgi:hypothetical protein